MSDERVTSVQSEPDIEVWPNRIPVWRCPVCGMHLTRAYNVNEGLKKCSKATHKATAERRYYEIVPNALPKLIEGLEEVTLPHLRYLVETKDDDDQALLNTEAQVREARRAL